jgi:DNA-binding XRE family transcriptional regulator
MWYILSIILFPDQEGEIGMDNKEFYSFRRRFQKTQKQMSQLLGTSLKAIQSFEQGWRKVPGHVERQMLFLMRMKNGVAKDLQPCWDIRNCSPPVRQLCPAWEFNAGLFCWFINGTICWGKPQESWARKMKICRRCEVFASSMADWDSAIRR